MLLNCGVGEDSWEFLGQQGNPTTSSLRKSVLNIHWKDWCWSWNSNTLATWCKELTFERDPDAGKDWRQEEKGMTKDEMVGWHHQLNGHEFEQALGVGDGQGSLACCSPQGCKEWHNWVTRQQQSLKKGKNRIFCVSYYSVYAQQNSCKQILKNANHGYLWLVGLWMTSGFFQIFFYNFQLFQNELI